MPDTRITKQRFKNHMEYSKRAYIIGVIVMVALASLLFTMTTPAVLNENSVGLALCDAYVSADKVTDADKAALLAHIQEYDEKCEEVNVISIAYDGDGTTEDGYYGAQVYMVQTAAGDNDIFFQNEQMAELFIANGYAVALDELYYFDDFVEQHPDVKLWWAEEPSYSDAEADEDEDDEDAAAKETAEKHCYAVDISSLTGLIDRGCYDVRGKWASVIVISKNQDTSLYALNDMFTVFGGN